MDELIIDERKYVSTKRAAKATGYAKDYVGQLCREGRVPARLVGRSWYVLESAIQDHRFGAPEETAPAPAELQTSTLPPTWESPRYEAASVEPLPTVRRMEPEVVQDVPAASSELQEAWREWFSMRGAPVAEEEPVEAFTDGVEGADLPAQSVEMETMNLEQEVPTPEGLPLEPQEEPVAEEEAPEIVPIRAIKTEAQPVRPIEEIIPSRNVPEPAVARERRAPVRKEGISAILKFGLATGAFAAVLLASLAVAGSGYADKYVASLGHMQLLAGISVYNK